MCKAVGLFALSFAPLLAVPIAAQVTFDAVVATDFDVRADVPPGAPVVHTVQGGSVLLPSGLPLIFGAGLAQPAGYANAYTRFWLREEPSRLAFEFSTGTLADDAVAGTSAVVEPVDVLVRYHVTQPITARFEVSRTDHDASFAVDAFHDGTVDVGFGTASPWSATYTLMPGVVEFRVTTSLQQRLVAGQSQNDLTLSLQTVDGCSVAPVSQGCYAPGVETFSVSRLLDGSIRMRTLLAPPAAGRFLIVGFSQNVIMLPPALVHGVTPCLLVPNHDVVVWWNPARGDTLDVPPLRAPMPVEAFLQVVDVATDGRLLVSTAHRLGCL